MNLYKCWLIKNDCYKAGRTMKPKGVMVHSTGANNPNIRRYVQPVWGQEDYRELMKLLGKNSYGNHWNRSGVDKCVHAFIGLLADGTVATVQTLPWDMRGWHCGSHANDTHISFEMCEDNLTDPEYFTDVYNEAVELTADLCKQYGLDPLADGVVLCHAEGYRRGIASGHADVEPWFSRQGKTMDDFRRDVKNAMEGAPLQSQPPAVPDPPEGEPWKGENEMTGEEIFNKLNEYTTTLTLPDWAREEYQEAIDMGITDGSNPMGLIPRYQAAIMAKRTAKSGAQGGERQA